MSERATLLSSDVSRRPHVLIVSDDIGLSGFLNEGLVIAGCWVSVVASGIQVLEVFRLRTFELALVDAALGGLGASELLRRLRFVESETDQPRTDIPIILLAEDDAELQAAGVDVAEVDGVIIAPIEIDSLALTIFDIVRTWRSDHPGRPWSDDLAQAPP
jgi:DNA-binding response OmpR family regulator